MPTKTVIVATAASIALAACRGGSGTGSDASVSLPAIGSGVARRTSITYETLLAYKHSTRLELADRVLNDLLRAARASGDPCAVAGAHRCEAVRALSAWDRSTDAASRGAVLFTTRWDGYARRAGGSGPYAVRRSEREPLLGPSGIGNVAIALMVLDSATARVKARWNRADVAWGEVYRLRRDTLDLPGNGGSGSYGIFRVATATESEDGRQVLSGGDSYVGVIEFGSPLRARSLIGYGNASQPGSPHRTDQLGLLARKELRPVRRTRGEMAENLKMRERF